MTPRRHKHLRPIQRPRQAYAFFLGEGGLEAGDVGGFLFVDVGAEVVEEGF